MIDQDLVDAFIKLKQEIPADQYQGAAEAKAQVAVRAALAGGPPALTALQHALAALHAQKLMDSVHYSHLLDSLQQAMTEAVHTPLHVRQQR